MLFQTWKMFQNNFDKNKKCSLPTILFEVEGKTADNFIVPSTDLIPLHASDKESNLSKSSFDKKKNLIPLFSSSFLVRF